MYQGFENDYGTPLFVEGPIAAYKTMKMPPIKWLIENVLKERGIGMLYGSTGAMKSYSLVDLGCRMCNGMDFHGRAMQKKNVIYVAGEAAEETYERIDAWCEFYGMDERPIIIPWAVMVNKQNYMDALKKSVRRVGNVGLVIFDNLADCSVGVQLSDPDHVGEHLKPHVLSFVREANCAVMFSHHTGKDDSKEERGARVLRDMTDTTIKAKKQSNQFDLVWSFQKVRRLGPQKDMTFHFEDISQIVGIDNIGIIKTGLRDPRKVNVETGEVLEEAENVVELRNASERLQHFIEEQGGRVAISAVLDHFEWRRVNGKPKQTYYDALKPLEGVVEKDENDLVLVPNDEDAFGTAAD